MKIHDHDLRDIVEDTRKGSSTSASKLNQLERTTVGAMAKELLELRSTLAQINLGCDIERNGVSYKQVPRTDDHCQVAACGRDAALVYDGFPVCAHCLARWLQEAHRTHASLETQLRELREKKPPAEVPVIKDTPIYLAQDVRAGRVPLYRPGLRCSVCGMTWDGDIGQEAAEAHLRTHQTFHPALFFNSADPSQDDINRDHAIQKTPCRGCGEPPQNHPNDSGCEQWHR